MSGNCMYGKCDICGKQGSLSRKYYYYDIKCECHSPNHFEIVDYCEECEPAPPSKITIKIKPKKEK